MNEMNANASLGTKWRKVRKSKNSKCDRITQAYYYMTDLHLTIKDKLELFKRLQIASELFDDKLVFMFNDGSLLAYKESEGFYTVDTFLRRSRRRHLK